MGRQSDLGRQIERSSAGWCRGRCVWACAVALIIIAFLPGSALCADGTNFYRVPKDISAFPIGAVVRAQPITKLSPLLGRVHGTRLMYRSEDEHGRAIGITGIVLVPSGEPPPGGWPIIAWAHGTTGVGLDCAPSRTRNLFENAYAGFIAGFLAAGFLIVATDYEGLGTGPLHKYINLDSEARSVIDAVRAARRLIPQAGRQWLVVGHSEGGHAAVGTGELANRRASGLQFLGTVAIAPAAMLETVFEGIETSPHKSQVLPYIAYLAAGMKATLPNFHYAELLSPEMQQVMPQAERRCLIELQAIFLALFHPKKILANNWRQSESVRQYLRNTEPGKRPSGGPLLIFAGGADIDVSPTLVDGLVRRLNAHGERVQYHRLPDDDHGTLLMTGFPTMLNWVHRRFHGSADAGRRVSPLSVQAARTLHQLRTDLEPIPFYDPPLAVEARAAVLNLRSALRALEAAPIDSMRVKPIKAALLSAIDSSVRLELVVDGPVDMGDRQRAKMLIAEGIDAAGRAERLARAAGL